MSEKELETTKKNTKIRSNIMKTIKRLLAKIKEFFNKPTRIKGIFVMNKECEVGDIDLPIYPNKTISPVPKLQAVLMIKRAGVTSTSKIPLEPIYPLHLIEKMTSKVVDTYVPTNSPSSYDDFARGFMENILAVKIKVDSLIEQEDREFLRKAKKYRLIGSPESFFPHPAYEIDFTDFVSEDELNKLLMKRWLSLSLSEKELETTKKKAKI